MTTPSSASPSSSPYVARRTARSTFVELRGLRYHAHIWGDASLASAQHPPLLLLHGWMDVGASFQFLVDELAQTDGFDRWVIAPDWRGFGLTQTPPADTYWFPDYLADLDALLDAWLPAQQFPQIDLLGHSMGGNVVMSYAGVRPERIRRLVNLEGFGLPRAEPSVAPKRLTQWLDELKEPQRLKTYASVDEVAARLLKNNPLLTPDKAAWLAPHWAQPAADGQWHVLGDPAHKRVNPVLYRVEEILQTWKLITAPVLWAEGDRTQMAQWWGNRYSHAEFDSRLAQVQQVQRVVLSPSGHMLHHDQPAALAQHLSAFLQAGG